MATDPLLGQLRPEFRGKVAEILDSLAGTFQPRISNALRTYEQQLEKVSLGYAMPGALNPGTHGYGLAADIIDGRYAWVVNATTIAFFKALRDLAVARGFTSGANWFHANGRPNVWAPHGIGWDPAHISWDNAPRELRQMYTPESETINTRSVLTCEQNQAAGFSEFDTKLLQGGSSDLVASSMRSFQTQLTQNALVCANVRPAKSGAQRGRFILSGKGLTDHPQKFSWAYFPPTAGTYRATPPGQKRPWSWIMLHSFSAAWDAYWFGHNRQLETAPGDEYNHHPARWLGAIRLACGIADTDTQTKPHRLSMHALISRRGDVIWSCDLNDIAIHASGKLKIDGRGNDAVCVGIKLESAFRRYLDPKGPWGKPYMLPYTDRQIMALAVVCRKLELVQPAVKRVYAGKANGSVIAQVQQYGGGYIQHKDVIGTNVLSTTQFDIPPGTRGLPGKVVNPFLKDHVSGWDQLWKAMNTVKLNLATDVFVDEIRTDSWDAVDRLSVALMQTTNGTQRQLLLAHRDRMGSIKRASAIQNQTRKTVYKQTVAQATTMNSIAARTTASLSHKVQAVASGGPTTIGGEVLTYDYETGLWKAGGVDTGKAT